jgi:hypothetical protein
MDGMDGGATKKTARGPGLPSDSFTAWAFPSTTYPHTRQIAEPIHPFSGSTNGIAALLHLGHVSVWPF